MASMLSSIRQAAAIAVKDGLICMVSSSSRKRWVIPKGCLEPGKSSVETALQEAWEEAGLLGTLEPNPIGTYCYEKWSRTCHVTVFLMSVSHAAERYPESNLRQRVWLTPDQAMQRMNDAGLRKLLHSVLQSERIALGGAAIG
jgi:8-oxo-dGTP pyrophosphatase MutT (NUDIX family)